MERTQIADLKYPFFTTIKPLSLSSENLRRVRHISQNLVDGEISSIIAPPRYPLSLSESDTNNFAALVCHFFPKRHTWLSLFPLNLPEGQYFQAFLMA